MAAVAGLRRAQLAQLTAGLEQVINQRTAELQRENLAGRTREQESHRQRQYFEALVHNSPVALVTLDLEDRVVGCNPAFTHLFGYTPAEAVGHMKDRFGQESKGMALLRIGAKMMQSRVVWRSFW